MARNRFSESVVGDPIVNLEYSRCCASSEGIRGEEGIGCPFLDYEDSKFGSFNIVRDPNCEAEPNLTGESHYSCSIAYLISGNSYRVAFDPV